MTLKEKYWKTGNIFELSTGAKKVVWYDNLLDSNGCIYGKLFNDNLVNVDSTIKERVIRVYSPNETAGTFRELTDTKFSDGILWTRTDYVFTLEEIKKLLCIPYDKELVITDYYRW